MTLLLCVPTFKAPYLVGEYKTEKEFDALFTKIKKTHDGVLLCPYPARMVVHPMFCDNRYWKQAETIINSGKATFYADEDGMNKFVPNMGLITNQRVGGCPHPFGEVFLSIKEKDLTMKKEELQTEEQYNQSCNGDEDEDEEKKDDE